MNLRHPGIAIFWLTALLAAPASAQTIYRCPGGYAQQPCAGGSAMEAGDERSSTQQRESAAAARRDAQLADRMEAERRQQEARAPAAYVPAAKAPAAAASARQKDKRNPKTKAASGVFTATVPGSGKDKAAKNSNPGS